MCAVGAIPALIGMAVSVASSAVATGMQVDASSKATAARAAAARRNALAATGQKESALHAGHEQARKAEILGRRAGARQLATLGVAGVETTTGAPANLPTISEMNAMKDAERIRASAARQAWGYETQTIDYRENERQARRAGYLGGVSAGFSGASRIANTATTQGGNLIQVYGTPSE